MTMNALCRECGTRMHRGYRAAFPGRFVCRRCTITTLGFDPGDVPGAFDVHATDTGYAERPVRWVRRGSILVGAR